MKTRVCLIYFFHDCSSTVEKEEGSNRMIQTKIKSKGTRNISRVLDCFSIFMKKLQQDIKMIRKSDKTMTFAKKTKNMYRLRRDPGWSKKAPYFLPEEIF